MTKMGITAMAEEVGKTEGAGDQSADGSVERTAAGGTTGTGTVTTKLMRAKKDGMSCSRARPLQLMECSK